MSDIGSLRAPDLAEVEALAHTAFAALPEAFKARCAGVTIHVEDFPDDATLLDMGCETEFDLLGLFRGVGLAQSGEVGTGQMPNAVWLYRRPILDYWAEHDETLGDVVTHVLVHEIGHHFGLSDDDMARIEAAAGPG
ncbi:metallopeptidase family protein [Methylobacterium sp. J-076]|uniref:metallopeptidase family protein n=1 Tax=Methylobacterium sp. J-076 TaxID=2836655 RepID=UPI001FBBE280|nr:metallopeptidase family protein [Methylobacterium sp. J-076]MCJ2011817.1 metallopeptidase family protein [Methylobacterium sp. J-076]